MILVGFCGAEDALDYVGGFAFGLDGFEVSRFGGEEFAGGWLGGVGLLFRGQAFDGGGEEAVGGDEADSFFDGDERAAFVDPLLDFGDGGGGDSGGVAALGAGEDEDVEVVEIELG